MTYMNKYLQFKLILGFQAILVLSLILMGYFLAAKVSDIIDDGFEFQSNE